MKTNRKIQGQRIKVSKRINKWRKKSERKRMKEKPKELTLIVCYFV
jgi:hypothetical protein